MAANDPVHTSLPVPIPDSIKDERGRKKFSSDAQSPEAHINGLLCNVESQGFPLSLVGFIIYMNLS